MEPIEEVLLHHMANLEALALLNMQGEGLPLYLSKATWRGEFKDAIRKVEYYDHGDNICLHYVVGTTLLQDCIMSIGEHYTRDALSAIVTQHREQSTLWQAIEQELHGAITSPDGVAALRLRPEDLTKYADATVQQHLARKLEDWHDVTPIMLQRNMKQFALQQRMMERRALHRAAGNVLEFKRQ